MSELLSLAIPSKGRLMEQCLETFAKAGLEVTKVGHERGYKGRMRDLEQVEVAFLSASEIARDLRDGRIHMGVTGEDLVRECMSDADERVQLLNALGFGHADVVVAVPKCWVDVIDVGDIEEAARIFRSGHGRRMRVATKYLNLTRRFFAGKGISSYRIVESLGATEGAPAAETAELIVDITSTGATLRANGLKQLQGGTILQSQANLFASNSADWHSAASEARNEIMSRMGALGPER